MKTRLLTASVVGFVFALVCWGLADYWTLGHGEEKRFSLDADACNAKITAMQPYDEVLMQKLVAQYAADMQSVSQLATTRWTFQHAADWLARSSARLSALIMVAGLIWPRKQPSSEPGCGNQLHRSTPD